MKSIIKIGEHTVLKGLNSASYVKIINYPLVLRKPSIPNSELTELLEKQQDIDYFWEPLWDYPLEEMQNGTVKDEGCFYVELIDDEGARYFETNIPNDEIRYYL